MPASAANTGWPFFFPTLFGSGADGDLTLTTNSDVGYLGSYGAKQAVNATLAAGQVLTIGQGTSSGALIIGCRGKLTIAGTITADGSAGGNAVASGGNSGAGGNTAGGGLGGASITTDNAGNNGAIATKFGHGAQQLGALGNGGGSGARNSASGAIGLSGGLSSWPTLSTNAPRRTLNPTSTMGGVQCDVYGLTGVPGTASVSGTAAPVNPTTNFVGPWSTSASGLALPIGFIPAGYGGFGGGSTSDGSTNDGSGGGGGGGGGVIIFEASVIELVAGYSITARGGNGGNATVQSGTTTAVAGSGGGGGVVLFICRTLIGSTAAINCNGGSPGTSAGSGAASGISGLAGAFYRILV